MTTNTSAGITGVNWISYPWSRSGFNTARLHSCHALRSVGVPVAHLDFSNNTLALTGGLPDEAFPHQGVGPNAEWPTVLHLRPSHMRAGIALAQDVGFTDLYGLSVAEVQLPSDCVNFPGLKGLIVPSETSGTFFRAAGYDSDSLHVIPHPMESLKGLIPPTPRPQYTYLFCGTWDARKGGKEAISAYLEAFRDLPRSTLLIVKTNAGTAARAYLYEESRRLGIVDHGPACQIIDTEMDTHALWQLFNFADCVVSPHRAEGFGLSVLQAKLLGLPVIYTDASAPCEIVKGPYDCPVGHSPALVSECPEFLGLAEFTAPGASWVVPSRADLVAAYCKMRDSPRSPYPHADRYSWARVGAQLKAALLHV